MHRWLVRRGLVAVGLVTAGLVGGVVPAQAAPGAGEGAALGAPPVVETRLPTLPGFDGTPTDVNARGQVVGIAAQPRSASPRAVAGVLWAGGEVVDVTAGLAPAPDGRTFQATVLAIADDGRVAGSAVSAPACDEGGCPPPALGKAFTWADGELVEISDEGAPQFDVAVDLNTRDQVLVNQAPAEGAPGRAAVWDDGTLRRSPLGADGRRLVGAAINADGVVAGTLSDGSPAERAAIWRPGRAPVDITPPGARFGRAIAINDGGQVLVESEAALGGRRLYLWSRGRSTDLGTLGGLETVTGAGQFGLGYPGSTRNQLGDGGHVVGRTQDATGEWRAFRWQAGTMTELPVPGGTGNPAALTPTAVNDDGVVVGLSGGFGATVPFGYVGGSSVVLLQAPAPGAFVHVAVGVGDRGHAIGYGVDGTFATTPYLWRLHRG